MSSSLYDTLSDVRAAIEQGTPVCWPAALGIAWETMRHRSDREYGPSQAETVKWFLAEMPELSRNQLVELACGVPFGFKTWANFNRNWTEAVAFAAKHTGGAA